MNTDIRFERFQPWFKYVLHTMFLYGHSGIVYEIYAIWIFLYVLSLIHGCRQNSWWIGLIQYNLDYPNTLVVRMEKSVWITEIILNL